MLRELSNYCFGDFYQPTAIIDYGCGQHPEKSDWLSQRFHIGIDLLEVNAGAFDCYLAASEAQKCKNFLQQNGSTTNLFVSTFSFHHIFADNNFVAFVRNSHNHLHQLIVLDVLRNGEESLLDYKHAVRAAFANLSVNKTSPRRYGKLLFNELKRNFANFIQDEDFNSHLEEDFRNGLPLEHNEFEARVLAAFPDRDVTFEHFGSLCIAYSD